MLAGTAIHASLEAIVQGRDEEVAYTEVMDKEKTKYDKGYTVFREKDEVTSWDDVENKVRVTWTRVVPVGKQYIIDNDLIGGDAEKSIRNILRHPTKETKTDIMIKGKIDLVKLNLIIDWKTASKDMEGHSLAYEIQGVIYALLHHSVTGIIPKEVKLVSLLTSETVQEKLEAYEQSIKDWEVACANTPEGGKKPRKPSKPRAEEKQRVREHTIVVTDWKVEVVIELINRITAEIRGENIIADGKAIPNLSANYGSREGWDDFCEEVLGYNPYTGEIKETKDVEEDEVEKRLMDDVDELFT